MDINEPANPPASGFEGNSPAMRPKMCRQWRVDEPKSDALTLRIRGLSSGLVIGLLMQLQVTLTEVFSKFD
jgi:hypothetical protein